MATTLHTTEEKAARYIERWRGELGLYPGIGKWHRRVDRQLTSTHTVYNAYGFRRFYTARTHQLLPQALAWICSSCVSVTINRGMKFVFGPNVISNDIEIGDDIDEEDRYDPWNKIEYIGIPQVELLMQIHDSIIGQMPREMMNETLPKIVKMMEMEIPYETPLVIPVTVKVGLDGEAWGDLQSWKEAA